MTKKTKVRCVAGSATLAPLPVAVASGIGFLLRYWFVIDAPVWVVWTLGIGVLIATPPGIWLTYQWFFEKCYRPS